MIKFEVYATIFTLAIIFTICDIVVSSCQLTIPSLFFSGTTMILSFIGAYMGKTIVVEQKYNEALGFIRKNFNLANIILSILDVLCCVLALLTGIFCLMLVFRCTIAMRLVVYINKYKTVSYAIWSLVFLHIFKLKGKNKMNIKFTKNSLFQNIILVVAGVLGIGGVVTWLLSDFTDVLGEGENIAKYVAIIQEALSLGTTFILGGSHDEVLSDEEVNSKIQVKAKKLAVKSAKAEIKAKQKSEIDSLVEEKMNELQPTVEQPVTNNATASSNEVKTVNQISEFQ